MNGVGVGVVVVVAVVDGEVFIHPGEISISYTANIV
jgi:hypothetical protein